MSEADIRIPVLVVGAGSVGLSVAAELGWRGVKCLTVERMTSLNPHPRANAVANRTMEYYRRWGIDGAISSTGVPPDHPADYYWVSSLHGHQIHKVSLPPIAQLMASRKTGGYAASEHDWSPYLKTITGQNEVESIIRDYVDTRKDVDLRFGWELMSFGQDGGGVNAVIAPTGGGRSATIRADYLVACDGGRSMVREQLGIPLSGRGGLARFVSLYFRAPDFMASHEFGNANIYFPIHRDYRGFILNWDGGTTFTYHLILRHDQEWDQVDPIAAVHAVLGCPIDVEVISTQPWTAHALTADHYSDGRVFLAGDAAHMFTPTGGFGMNTGVSDAIDIAWKLKAMLDGWGGERLLSSYSVERQPVGVRNTMEAANCFDLLYGVMQNGDELDADTVDGEALRARLNADLKDQEKLVSSSGTLLGYRYEGSPIVIPDGTPEPEDHPRHYVSTGRPGHRAPHIWLDEEISILDYFGPDFTLLVLKNPVHESGGEDTSPLAAAAAAVHLPLKIVEINHPAAFDVYQARFVLIRPDLMVAWRGDCLPKNPTAVLDIVRGAG